MNIITLRTASVVGLTLAIYAVFVENKTKKDNTYHPVCEINDKTSCKTAFNSEYGKILGISNAIFGIIFYVTFIILTFTQFTNILLLMSIAAVLGSAYLAYALYFKLRNFCIVCTGTYIVNLVLLYFVIF